MLEEIIFPLCNEFTREIELHDTYSSVRRPFMGGNGHCDVTSITNVTVRGTASARCAELNNNVKSHDSHTHASFSQ